VLENAQFLYALSRFPKRQVLGDPIEVKKVRDRLYTLNMAARELSATQRKTVDVPWEQLADERTATPDGLWTAVKKVTPKLIAELMPLVRDAPEAGFLISLEPREPRSRKPAAQKRKR